MKASIVDRIGNVEWILLLFLLIVVIMASGEQSLFDVHDYDMFGNRLAVHQDKFVVITRNDLRQFFIGYDIGNYVVGRQIFVERHFVDRILSKTIRR